jgi:hypothetical protein
LHFISTCYAKLEDLNQNTQTPFVGGTEWESARTFVQECIQTAASISQHDPELSNLDRARLLDILFWANELDRRFLRDPNTQSS